MQPSLRTSLAVPAALGSLLALPAAAGEGCERPGMNVVPACGVEVVPDDGATDLITVHPNEPLAFQYSVGGLDHEKSLLISAGYATFALYAVTPAEVPFPLAPCADLALPFTASVLPVPSNTLELPVEIQLPISAPSTVDLWHQTLSVDLLTPGFPIATSDLARVRFQKEACGGDPTTDHVYDCHVGFDYQWDWADGVGPVTGRIFWPVDCQQADTPAGDLPLAVIAHDEGAAFHEYSYLLSHFARNGFIAVSVDVGQGLDNVDRAARVRNFISFVREAWVHEDFVQNRIALIGHGRGAEAMLAAARKMNDDWNETHDVQAVVCLAPTNEGGVEGLESENFDGGWDGGSLLVIHGSLDNVATGYCKGGNAPDCGAIPTAPQRTGFAIFDGAVANYSSMGITPPGFAVEKSMLFVEGADHDRWRDQPCVDPPPFMLHKPLDCDTHHDIAKGYLNAFLRWQLSDEDEYQAYFTGEWTPGAVAATGTRIQVQYQDDYGRRVLDAFENGDTLDGGLTTVEAEGPIVLGEHATPFDDANFTIPHDTGLASIGWQQIEALPTPAVRWLVPDGGTITGGVSRNFSGHGALSFRVGLVDEAPKNPVGEGTSFSVRLKDGLGVTSSSLQVRDFAELPYPHQSVVTTPLFFTKQTAKSAMRTVRLPLSGFQGVDLTDIREVELVFDDPEHPTGEILLDLLELAP